jgi:hypothetical protein
MANYKISGIWKNSDNVITHYAFHEIGEKFIDRGKKTSKAEAVKILSISSNEAVTWLWNYKTAYWTDGAKVDVVNGEYLRTVHDSKVVDNLAHLIDYDWLAL